MIPSNNISTTSDNKHSVYSLVSGPYTSASRMEALRNVIRILRSPKGCPWDREQTIESLKASLLEESFEAADAIDHGDSEHTKEELGDVLLIVLLMSQIAEDGGKFRFEDVMTELYAKLIRRHPHVFGDEAADNSGDVKTRWAEIKKHVEGREADESVLDSVPVNMSPILRSQKLQKKAAKAGFDWPGIDGPLDKIREEIAELEAEVSADAIDRQGAANEIGDLLFSVVNLSRHLGISADDALRATNRRFSARFRHVEREMGRGGQEMSSDNLQLMEEHWQEAKKIQD
ncbi:MAG: nucleoside triphosphate pyrophosphohydrolase [Spirochaetaceae bacterium]|nr:MAG: nucleoside triphosphate pyrophosphohydrolase [Spirochaetaceae bacterium]